MRPILIRSSVRSLRRHPWQAALSILGVAVGVAVVVGIDLANASAQRAFDLSTRALAGRTTHQVTGGPTGLPEELFVEIVTSGALIPVTGAGDGAPGGSDRDRPAATPLVEGYGVARSEGNGGAGAAITLQVLGIDPFSEGPVRSYLGLSGTGDENGAPDMPPLVTRPGAGLLTSATAAEIGLAPGDPFTLEVGGIAHRVELAGLLRPADPRSRRALRGVLVLDVASAQEILDRLGRLDRVDLVIPEALPGSEAVLERVRSLLPPGADIRPAASRNRTFEQMTRAFRLNLAALSLLALVCGMFLIYNTMTFAVVRRRTLFGTLRALGVTRGEILAMILAEAAAVAVLGTALGLTAGTLLGEGLVRLVTRTINDLYFVLSVRELAVEPWVLAKGAALGLLTTVGAALVPALEATTAPPRAVLTRSVIETRARKGMPRAAAAGVTLAAVGGLLLAISEGLPGAFAGLFAVIVGSALLTPAATVGFMALARRPAEAVLGVLGKMAARGVVATLSRTGVAIAALAVAVSVTVGVGVMISSFRTAVVQWLDLTLRADVYVRAPDPDPRSGREAIEPRALDRIRETPGVGRVDLMRRAELRLAAAGSGKEQDGDRPDRTSILALDLGPEGRGSFRLREGDPAAAWQAVESGDGVLVSEPFALLRGFEVGDRVRLESPVGERAFPVVGVYADYGTDQGAVLMDMAAYREIWGDRSVTGASIYAAAGTDPDDLAVLLRRRTAEVQSLLVRSNRELRRLSLEIFDRTFVVTDVLRLLAGLVAFIGVLSALMALELERARELGVLRANGLTPGQVWKLVTAETGLMGLAAGLLSLPLGLALAAIMVYVINRRSFGWTLTMELSPGILAGAVALALGAALLAGLYPAWRMSRVSPAEALREE